jgi:hypothetical protein
MNELLKIEIILIIHLIFLKIILEMQHKKIKKRIMMFYEILILTQFEMRIKKTLMLMSQIMLM